MNRIVEVDVLRLMPIFDQPRNRYKMNWEQEIGRSVRDIGEIERILGLPHGCVSEIPEWPLLVPRTFIERMKPGDPNDPLLLQVLPRIKELSNSPGFSRDPLEEGRFDSCVFRKYESRALVLCCDDCAVRCRFCFRRHFPRGNALFGGTEMPNFEEKLLQIRNDPSVTEIVLSGGDPLILPDADLQKLIYYIENLPNVNRVRVHSRLPVLIPERITDHLLELLKTKELGPVFYLVLHINHPNEIDEKLRERLFRLSAVGIPILSQTVLLKKVNDDFATLRDLFVKCIENRIIPYYLHQLDKIAGAAHFEVPESEGRELIRKLRAALPGYAIPRYVRETTGGPGKSVIE